MVMTVIAYDVNTADKRGAKRLRRVAKTCVNYGQRVQNSVFEVVADAATLARLKAELLNIIDQDRDSLRFYSMGSNYPSKIQHYGAKRPYDAEGFLAL